MSQHDEVPFWHSEPHQVSEPENPLDYYRRLQAAEAALAAEREKSRVLADEKKEAVRLGQLHWEDWDRAEKALAAEREAHENETAHREAIHEEYVRVCGQRDDAEAALARAQNEAIVRTTAIANLHSVIAERDRALARADALVRECEWKATAFVIGDDSKTYVAAACPICRRPQPDGHTLDCALAAHLRDREGGAA